MNFLFNKSQVYKDTYKFYQYNNENIRVVHMKACRQKGFEDIKKHTSEKEEVERVSISRTRRNIRELALCNNFEYFCTFTVKSKESRFHLDKVQEDLRKLFKAYKRKNKNFAYIFITEKHKDGAFHFHGLIKGINENDIVLFKKEDFEKLPYYILKMIDKGEKIYYFPFFQTNLGWTTVTKVKSVTKVSNYILKYITKDCVKNSSGTVYISSRGLKKADCYEIKPISCYWDYENDYCQIKDFNISEMSQTDILQFYNINEKELTIKNLYNKIINK